MLACSGSAVQLVAELTDEADPEREARDAGHADLLGVEVAQRLVRDVRVGQAREGLTGVRACEIEGCERAGDVDDLGVVAPDGVPPLEPLADALRARRG